MLPKDIQRISILGTGKVATHLAKILKKLDFDLIQIFGRNQKVAQRLAQSVEAEAISSLQAIHLDVDVIIIAVADNAIETLARQLPKDSFVVHTSGATPSAILSTHFQDFGVFYPLQSFSLEKIPDWSIIPIIVDANTNDKKEQLIRLAKAISPLVYTLDDTQRAQLHLAAVFANNFVNYCFHMAYSLLAEKAIPFDLLKPIILETALKVQQHLPSEMQTGPAIRKDENTIERHLQLLEHQAEWKKIYELMTQQIQEMK
jgi:predicted short-subunit dehydrogenase-like oxidoreductase (DUF2520 family)